MLSFVALALFATLGVTGDVAQAGADRSDVIITFAGPPNASDQAAVRAVGGDIGHTFSIVNAISASLPSGAINGLSNNPRVLAVEPDVEVHALDAELDSSWGVKRIGSGDVHFDGNSGAGVNVAVVDSGVDYGHADLAANYAGGYDFVNGDADPMDDYGHGTHVAGTIAAVDDGNGVVGVAPGANIFALKVLGNSGSGSFSDIIAAIDWTVLNGIQVTNNSYGSSIDPGTAVQAAFDNSAALGVLHIASAGNSGNVRGKGNNVGYPARYDSVVAVAATDSSDDRASFSSTGPAVEISGPGVAINSTQMGGGYTLKNGTSMASPHVAGVAALIIASGNSNARLALQQSADDLGKAGLDKEYGYGLVNAANAVGAPPPPANNSPVVTITSPSDGAEIASGASIAFAGTVTDVEDDNATLTGQLEWSSSLTGAITLVGGSAVLDDGTHTITASVTDSGGETGSGSVTITVGTPPTPPEPGVLLVNITLDPAGGAYGFREDVLITVTVTDTGSDPSNGAAVHVLIDPPKGFNLVGDADTDANGSVTFIYTTSKRSGKGTYNVTADAVNGSDSGSASTSFTVS